MVHIYLTPSLLKAIFVSIAITNLMVVSNNFDVLQDIVEEDSRVTTLINTLPEGKVVLEIPSAKQPNHERGAPLPFGKIFNENSLLDIVGDLDFLAGNTRLN